MCLWNMSHQVGHNRNMMEWITLVGCEWVWVSLEATLMNRIDIGQKNIQQKIFKRKYKKKNRWEMQNYKETKMIHVHRPTWFCLLSSMTLWLLDKYSEANKIIEIFHRRLENSKQTKDKLVCYLPYWFSQAYRREGNIFKISHKNTREKMLRSTF